MTPLYLMILDLTSHHAEGIVARVVIDVDSAEACGASSRDPLLVGIVVHHDSSPCLADALFTASTHTQKVDIKISNGFLTIDTLQGDVTSARSHPPSCCRVTMKNIGFSCQVVNVTF